MFPAGERDLEATDHQGLGPSKRRGWLTKGPASASDNTRGLEGLGTLATEAGKLLVA